MDRTLFAQRLVDAATRARDFARPYLEEVLPDAMLFDVQLNASYDGNPLHADEVVFPEDSGRGLFACALEQAVAALWRATRVPEWVNVSVVGIDGDHTMIELLSCGRFTENDALLYHQQEGRPPFHVLGPALPPEWEEGQRFSIYHRASASTAAGLEALGAHAAKVWSLRLNGSQLALDRMPVFPNLEILELHGVPLEGPDLAALARQPRLRVLRADRADGSFHVPALPRMPALEHVSLSRLPSAPWGFGALLAAVPRLKELKLYAAGPLLLDAPCPRELGSLYLSAAACDVTLPRKLDTLSLHLRDATDASVLRLVDGVDEVHALHLRHLPVGDAVVEQLVERWPLEFLDVVGTRVSDALLARLAARPGLKLLPTSSARAPASRRRP